MKILYIVHQFFPFSHTGSERLTLDTAKQIQRMGHFVTVLTYEPLPQEKPEAIESSKTYENNPSFEELDEHIMKREYQYETIPVVAIRYKKPTLGFKIFDENIEKHLLKIVRNFDIVHFTHPMFFL